MEEIKKLLEAREKELIKLKQEKEKALQNVPKGALRICNSGNKTQYYYREEPEDHSGTYISVKQQELISKYSTLSETEVIKELSQITLEMLASLNSLEKQKTRFIEITVDGEISDDEIEDFNAIKEKLEQISQAVDSLKMWVEKEEVSKS